MPCQKDSSILPFGRMEAQNHELVQCMEYCSFEHNGLQRWIGFAYVRESGVSSIVASLNLFDKFLK